jgi:hypothetical protein
MAKDSVKPSKKVTGQSPVSDVSDVAGALVHVGTVSPMTMPKSLILAKNDPKTVQGYEKLGTAKPVASLKPKDNRGEGSM